MNVPFTALLLTNLVMLVMGTLSADLKKTTPATLVLGWVVLGLLFGICFALVATFAFIFGVA